MPSEAAAAAGRPGRIRAGPVVLCLLLSLTGATAASPRALDLHTLEPAEPLQDPPPLHFVSFFQPACDWCRRQLAALQELAEECTAARTLAVGVWGSAGALRRELRAAKLSLPAYRATPELLAALDVRVVATPLTLVRGPGHETLLELRGFADGERLRAIVAAVLGPDACAGVGEHG